MAVSSLVAAGGGVTQKVTEFTSTGTFTVPSNCSAVEVFLVGGGGGGGTFQENGQCAGSGGGGGLVKRRMLTVTPGASITVTIGAGGAGGNSNTPSAGGSGGDSSFGSLLTARGGGGGMFINNNTGTGVAPNPRGSTAGLPSNGTTVGGGGGGAALMTMQSSGKGGSTIAFPSFGPSGYANITNEEANNATSGTAPGDMGGTGGFAMDNSGNGIFVLANPGVEGYGAGGFGASIGTNPVARNHENFSGLRALIITAGSVTTNGANAIANSGNGGNGGGSTVTGTTKSYTSGNGASGYCRVIYWS